MKVLALHQEKNSFSYAVLERRRKKILLHEVGNCSLSYLQDLKKAHRSFSYATCLRSSHVFVKKTKLPKTKRTALNKALPLYAETLSPIDPKDSFFLPIISFQNEKVETQFIFTKQSHLKKHIHYWRQKGFDPDYVTIVAQTLIRFCKSLFPELKDSYVLHVGKKETTLIWMKNHLLYASICLDFHAGDLQGEEGKESKHPINEIYSTIHSLEVEDSLPLLITGHHDQGFAHALEEALSDIISHIIPHKGKLGQWGKYATSIGAGLDALSKDHHRIQLRIKEFTPKKKLREVGKAISFCYLFSFFLIFYISSQFSKWVSVKENHLLPHIQQSIAADDALMERKVFQNDDPDELLSRWEKELHLESTPLPFRLTLPSASTFLHWMSSHPLMDPKDVEVRKITYDLMQYPTIKEPLKRYQAKVSLDLHIPSSLHARKLHDTLRADHSFIDQKKQKLEWREENNHYNLSFYLRNNHESI